MNQPAGMEDYEEMTLIQCIRSGCTNQIIDSIDWDREFCSNECAVLHCRDIFNQFVKETNENSGE